MVVACIILIIGIAGADLLGKRYIEEHFQKNQTEEIAGGKIQLRKVHNQGFALNRLDEKPDMVKNLSFAATVAAFLYELWLFRKSGNHMGKIGLALMSGGAVSNTYDRIKRGYVVDYIGFPLKKEKYAKITYNIGDFAIFIGAILMCVGSFGKRK